MRLLSP